MKQFLFIITIFCLASAKTFAYNPFWTHADKRLISAIVTLHKNNPKEIEQYFKTKNCDTLKETLGFGWTMWTPGIGSGYITIGANFYYYHDSLISYSLTPQLPEEKGLQKRYKKWYSNYFAYSNSKIQPFKFNEAAILNPLKEYNGTLKNISESIVSYMTPNSGTMYGYAGSGMVMQNRQAFLRIQNSLSNDQVILIMFSINPASRLTAIEYYWRHKECFEKNGLLDNWIEQNFREMPTIKSMSGCFSVTENTASYVYWCSLMVEK